MSERILMCAPEHFDVVYVINPWMEGNIALADDETAHRQWNTLAAAIAEVAQVERLAPVAGVPDMVFTANAGLVIDGHCILSRFRHAERQAEEPFFEAWFRAHGFRVSKLPEGVWFEGAGDALFDPGRNLVWLGHGHRSDELSAPMVAEIFGVDVEPLRLVDDRYYHLDTCLCVLENGYLMYHPAAFDAVSNERIAARVPVEKRIVVDAADAAGFACNAVNVGADIFLNHASAHLRARLGDCGFRARALALGEFLRAGGAAKCLTLKLDQRRREAVVGPPGTA
jgi:N-dimethylarginine dimethylaminohydrolase